MTKIVCIADTHCLPISIPACDLLLHAGDITMRGDLPRVERALQHLTTLPAKRIILVPGNHDFLFQQVQPEGNQMARALGIEVLIDACTVAYGLNIYGTPWQPWFHDWAFNAPQDFIAGADFLQQKWDAIPADTDILVTHCPPKGYGDFLPGGRAIGCPRLTARVREVQPALHVFGHCHHGHGIALDTGKTTFVNAAICNEQYQAVNAPIVVNI